MSWVAVAVGAAAGAGLGAIAGSAKGGDAIWKGALTGAVAGAASGGMYSWAPLGAGAVGGALAGGTGGLVSGALGTALNGGNSSDYLRNMFTQGATGALLGGAGGAAFGPSAGEAGAIPTAPETATAATGTEYAPFGGDTASGLGNVEAAPGVQQSITGPTAQPTQPALSDTVNNLGGNQYAAANTGTMTDIGGSSAIPQELPGGVSTGTQTSTTPSMGETAFTFDDYPSQAMIDQGTANTMGTQELANSPAFKMKELGADLGMDTYGYGKTLGQTAPKGQGKNMNDMFDMYLKNQMVGGAMRGIGGLVGAGEAQQNRQQLMDLYNQQNAQNQFYNNQLQQTYQNPQAYLGSPEAQATRSMALQKALATNAAAGRRTQGAALNNLLMQEQLKNLGAYRAGMPRPSYGTANQIAQAAQQQSPLSSITGGLANIFTPAAAAYLYS